MTRSLSKLGGGESLTDEHKNLLVRLMSKGLEYRTTSEQVRGRGCGGAWRWEEPLLAWWGGNGEGACLGCSLRASSGRALPAFLPCGGGAPAVPRPQQLLCSYGDSFSLGNAFLGEVGKEEQGGIRGGWRPLAGGAGHAGPGSSGAER